MNSNEKEEDGILKSWMIADAALAENTPEDVVINSVSKLPVKTKRSSVHISRIVAAYCILTVISLTVCFWKGDFNLSLGLPDFQPAVANQFIPYYLLTLAAVLLSGLCFLGYWKQSKMSEYSGR